jgi:[acyl-carrier-protein] S-malonyltransferase
MKKLVALFPGQGSQYVGMGSKINDPAIFDQAGQAIDFNLSQLCFNGPEEQLKLTQFTQPAIVAHSYALWTQLLEWKRNKPVEISQVLGHSVGEYAALVAAGSLDFIDAIKAVHYRGQVMQEAVAQGVGSMFAVLRAEADLVNSICSEVSQELSLVVSAANYNDDSQIVISGHKEACQKVCEKLSQLPNQRIRCIELAVSAPFHCQLMQPAELKMAKFLTEINIAPNQISYIANIDAKTYPLDTTSEQIKSNLIKQVCGSVLWAQSIKSLIEFDCVFVEVGPSKVLTGLVRKIIPNAAVVALDSENAWDELDKLL